ncbi:hypothetical protein PAPYR_7857 [Paratrimastix pyriformis]|uniref:Bromo domain-containing protein n=1 Tax=Paratrimastix pyriformis TaxID=342808 RepID=A0ABQ8UEM7_9EUKA|nr:hypothetical protein PAPYR_7857 [Paratrimastix pyriformis]
MEVPRLKKRVLHQNLVTEPKDPVQTVTPTKKPRNSRPEPKMEMKNQEHPLQPRPKFPPPAIIDDDDPVDSNQNRKCLPKIISDDDNPTPPQRARPAQPLQHPPVVHIVTPPPKQEQLRVLLLDDDDSPKKPVSPANPQSKQPPSRAPKHHPTRRRPQSKEANPPPPLSKTTRRKDFLAGFLPHRSTPWKDDSPRVGDQVVWFADGLKLFMVTYRDQCIAQGIISPDIPDAAEGHDGGVVVHVETASPPSLCRYTIKKEDDSLVVLPFLPFLDCDVPQFLIKKEQYLNALGRWSKGSYVSVPFTHPDKPGWVLWYEGRIWDVNEGPSPWQALKVLWYEQRRHDGAWMVAIEQSEPSVSCWECSSSPSLGTRAPEFPSVAITPELVQQPLRLIKEVFANLREDVEGINVFWDPVDPQCAPGYADIVKNPTCLKKIASDVSSGKIATWRQFVDAITLCAENSVLFNPITRFEYRVGEMLRKAIQEYDVQVKNIVRTSTAPMLAED